MIEKDTMPKAHFESLRQLEYTYWWHQTRLAIAQALLHSAKLDRPAILDLGCGTGGFLEQMATALNARRAVGVDSSPQALDLSRDRKIEFQSCDLMQVTDFGPEKFDVVMAMDVLEHLPAERPALDTAALNLRAGGLFVCSVPAHMYLFSEWDKHLGHFRRYHRAMLKKIFDGTQLEPVRCTYAFSHALIPALLQRLIRKPYSEKTCVFPPVPAAVNSLMLAVGKLEARWLRRFDVPNGLSVVALAVKKS